MGAFLSVFIAVGRSIVSTIPNILSRIASVIYNKNIIGSVVKQVGTRVVSSTSAVIRGRANPTLMKVGIPIISMAVGYAQSFGYFISGFVFSLLVYWLYPILHDAMEFVKDAVVGATQQWSDRVHVYGRAPKWERFLLVLIRVVPATIRHFFNVFIATFLRHVSSIIGLFFLTFVMVYGVERHMDETIAGVSVIIDLVLDGLNLFGRGFEYLFYVLNLVLPIANMMVRSQVLMLIHIYDGVVHSLQVFGAPRQLSAIGLSQSFMDSIQPLINVLAMLANLELEFGLFFVDFFFQSGIAYAISSVADIIMVVVTKILCALVGLECTFLEFFDFFVYDILFSFFEIFCFNLCTIPRTHDIACPTARLVERGVSSQCLGSAWSREPPGLFRNAPTSARRDLRMTCSRGADGFVERVPGQIAHITLNESLACPHAKAAFDPYGDALNLAVLNTHECYTLCVRELLIEACVDQPRKYLGTCGGASVNVTHAVARRRLDKFFGFASALEDGQVIRDALPIMTRAQMIQAVRDKVGPPVFSTGNVHCDFRMSPTNIYEITVDAACLASRVVDMTNAEHVEPRRGLKQVDRLDTIDRWRHKIRAWKTHRDGYQHPTHPQQESAVDRLRRGLTELVHVKRPKFKHRGRVSTAGRRRHLEEVAECRGQHVCPDNIQCVDNPIDCDTADELSWNGYVRLQIDVAIVFVESIDIEEIVYGIYTCWKDLEANPEKDPYSGGNIGVSDAETRCTWCTPMLKPTEWTFVPTTYSFRDDIARHCEALDPVYTRCRCPMFNTLPSSHLPLFEFLDMDLLLILENGFIWYRNLFVGLFGTGFGMVWTSLFPEPTIPQSFSRAFLLYSDDISSETYIVCAALHTGSALVSTVTLALIGHCMLFSFLVVQSIANDPELDKLGWVKRMNDRWKRRRHKRRQVEEHVE